jgi:integrase
MAKQLTVKSIEALAPATAGARYDVADSIVSGFGVRVNDKGRKSYTLTARFPGSKNPTRRTIARVGAIDLAEARNIAREWLSSILAGIDPNETKISATSDELEKRISFNDVAIQFLEQHVKRSQLRSAGEIERLIFKELMPYWKDREFISIRRSDVANRLDEIEARAPVVADYVLAIISKMCNWYMTRNEDYVSPIIRGMRRTKPRLRARDRILSDDEIVGLWQACDKSGTFGDFLKICLLTGQRRSKVQYLRWDDVNDNGVWTIESAPREKTNAQSLKLSPLALQIINDLPRFVGSPFAFPGKGEGPINGFSKSKSKIDDLMATGAEKQIQPWTIHDLRRTSKSLMSRAGVRPDVSERVLGHTIAGVEGIYDRYAYDDEKAEALEKLAGLIKEILGKSEKCEFLP